MRTRESNQRKRYTVQKYDFDDSEDEAPADTGRRRRKVASDDDDNFDETAVAAESAGDEDEDENASQLPVSDVEMSDAEAPEKSPPARRRSKPAKPANAGVGVRQAGYLDIEPMPTDGHPLRGYAGPYDRSFRGQVLVNAWYGPSQERIEQMQDMLDQWQDFTVLPPRPVDDSGEDTVSPWFPRFHEEEARTSGPWLERMKGIVPKGLAWLTLSLEESQPYRMPLRQLPVLLGPYPEQFDVKFNPGDSCPVSQSCSPVNPGDPNANIPTGWLLDCGGLVIGMDWAPHLTGDAAQLLALAIIPHEDQEPYDFELESARPDFERFGVVQLWEFAGKRDGGGVMRPSTQKPNLRKTMCLDCGRARRIKWSPVGGYMAILCGDGNVYIVQPGEGGEDDYELMTQPIAVLGLLGEDDVKATTMTWINVNRFVVGYSDGSVGLWSINPQRLISRHPIHHNAVVDIASGYPTMPYVLACTPIGGTAKVVDIRSPGYETTAAQALLINPQPNLLAYSDHLMGFFSIFPSSNALNTIVGFMHHASFPLVRRIFTGDSFLTCLSVGRTHPFLLIGMTDGSLWALNPMVELFTSRREPSDRRKVFQHEHRPSTLFPMESPASARGATRILQGFKTEKNHNPRTEMKAATKKVKTPKKSRAGAAAGDDNDEEAGSMDPSRGVVHDPMTRITVVQWNPNEGYGCWAAAAMGSGLVRVMDLGLDRA
ncbi:Transcription factor tau subunit sfc6 [Paramyrothecium foliicola]|nr:Transcription factor tau subunit sfc6 [Paramyrothecium foliicola]